MDRTDHSPAEDLNALLERAADRRRHVLDALGDRAALVLAATPELGAGRDTELPYVVDPELYYLTGWPEPEGVAVFLPEGAEHRYVLFVRPQDPKQELWTGRRIGPDAARDLYGADVAHPIGELEERLPALLADADVLHVRTPSARPDVERAIRSLLATSRAQRARRGRGLLSLVDPRALLDEMRLRKEPFELDRLRRAAAITAAGFRAAAGAIRPGAGEWQVQAALEAEFRNRGAQGPAFQTIVASGAGATVLHYVANDRVLEDGDLVLVDAGARWRGYAGDITRTFPVSGRFTETQRHVYEIVLAARDAAIAAVRPGAVEADVHAAAVRELVRGLVALGVIPAADDG